MRSLTLVLAAAALVVGVVCVESTQVRAAPERRTGATGTRVEAFGGLRPGG